MDRLIYVAMTGAKEIMQRQEVANNNLANLNTTGFRADQAAFRSLPVFNLEQPTRAYVGIHGMSADFSPGTIQTTGRDMDVAVDGKGWIAVQGPDGQEAYTRNGSFFVSPSGVLQTADGHAVLGSGGPINLPPLQSLQIAPDGTISGVPQGQSASSLVVLERIKLVNPPEASLQKGEDGLFRSGQSAADADPAVRLASGALESSNVNAIKAMIDMIGMSRQFEEQIKLIRMTQQDSQKSSQIMNLNG